MDMLNVLDYIIFGIAMIGAIWGAIKGFIEEVAQKFGYVTGFIAALMFTGAVSPFFRDNLSLPQWLSSFSAWFCLFILGYLLMKLLGSMLQAIFSTANITIVDNILGFVLGLAEAVIIIGLLETLLVHQSLFNFTALFKESFFSNRIIMPVFNWLTGAVHKAVS